MNDRELLELAAKAADINIEYWHTTGTPMFRNAKGLAEFWNPLTDDGDALRLAVALGIEIIPDRQIATVITAFCVHSPDLIGLNTMEEFSDDEMAATRRAIVRAAAEIGKTRSD